MTDSPFIWTGIPNELYDSWRDGDIQGLRRIIVSGIGEYPEKKLTDADFLSLVAICESFISRKGLGSEVKISDLRNRWSSLQQTKSAKKEKQEKGTPSKKRKITTLCGFCKQECESPLYLRGTPFCGTTCKSKWQFPELHNGKENKDVTSLPRKRQRSEKEERQNEQKEEEKQNISDTEQQQQQEAEDEVVSSV